MIEFEIISDPKTVLSFVKGNGVRRKCAGGIDLTDEEVIKSYSKDNIYLNMIYNGNSVGMVIFDKRKHGYGIHLCLRTIGVKTREIFSFVIELARISGMETIYADFPKQYRACKKLADEFNFSDVCTSDEYWHKSLKLI